MATIKGICSGSILMLLLTISGMVQKGYAQEALTADSLQRVLISKEKILFDVIQQGNKAEMDQLMGEDYITINADGVMQDKTQAMKTMGKFKGAAMDIEDRKIRVYGHTAIITGRAKAHMKGMLAADFFYTETWVFRNNDWSFIGWQGTMTGLPAWYGIFITFVLLLLFFLAITMLSKVKKIVFEALPTDDPRQALARAPARMRTARVRMPTLRRAG